MKKPNPIGWRTAKKERVAYGLYFLGQNMIYTFPFMFLTTYLLMSGISPVKTAGILVLLKVWDAVNDALFGGLIDHYVHTTFKVKTKVDLFFLNLFVGIT